MKIRYIFSNGTRSLFSDPIFAYNYYPIKYITAKINVNGDIEMSWSNEYGNCNGRLEFDIYRSEFKGLKEKLQKIIFTPVTIEQKIEAGIQLIQKKSVVHLILNLLILQQFKIKCIIIIYWLEKKMRIKLYLMVMIIKKLNSKINYLNDKQKDIKNNLINKENEIKFLNDEFNNLISEINNDKKIDLDSKIVISNKFQKYFDNKIKRLEEERKKMEILFKENEKKINNMSNEDLLNYLNDIGN